MDIYVETFEGAPGHLTHRVTLEVGQKSLSGDAEGVEQRVELMGDLWAVLLACYEGFSDEELEILRDECLGVTTEIERARARLQLKNAARRVAREMDGTHS